MKNLSLIILITGIFLVACGKEEESDRFRLLTGPVWHSDSLLVNGVDASGPAGLLEDFKGDVKFNKDRTGTFGKYEGTWSFASNETQLMIMSDSLQLPLTTTIVELTQSSLKVTTSYQIPTLPLLRIRMTFKPK